MSESSKQISFPIWNLDTNEIEDVFMDESDYNIMVESEKKYKQEWDERIKKLQEEDWILSDLQFFDEP